MTSSGKPAKNRTNTDRGEVLVAIMNQPRDLAILREQGWYRIPVAKAPKRWPPQWLAFYQTKAFDAEAYAVHYYGRISRIEQVPRRELFPNELPSHRSDLLYHRLWLENIEQLAQPIHSARWRRIIFIPTTWRKFTRAVEINDLFDESPLEDTLWSVLKAERIAAERQWELKLAEARYFLDFALFCAKGRIDIETDGDTWHANRRRIPQDNQRDNAVQAQGWHVLRFNTRQVKESAAEYCVPQIKAIINRLGGLSDEGLVPRVFHTLPDGGAAQLSLLDQGFDAELD